MKNMPPALPLAAKRRSTYLVTVGFEDETGAAVTPNTVTWSLKDIDGNVINSRSAVSETPDTSVNILLSGLDLDCPEYGEKNVILTVTIDYDSANGSNLPAIAKALVKVRDY